MTRSEEEAIRGVLAANARRDTAYLIAALRDPYARPTAARLLAKRGTAEAIPELLRLLVASDPHARDAAVHALGRLRSAEAVSRLISLAENETDLAVQTHAIAALERIGDPTAVPVLLRLLENPNWMVRDGAARALGALGDASTVEPLQAAAKRQHFLRRGAYRKALRRLRARDRA